MKFNKAKKEMMSESIDIVRNTTVLNEDSNLALNLIGSNKGGFIKTLRTILGSDGGRYDVEKEVESIFQSRGKDPYETWGKVRNPETKKLSDSYQDLIDYCKETIFGPERHDRNDNVGVDYNYEEDDDDDYNYDDDDDYGKIW